MKKMLNYKKMISTMILAGIALIFVISEYTIKAENVYEKENFCTEETDFYELSDSPQYYNEISEALGEKYKEYREENGYTEGFYNEDLAYNAEFRAKEIFENGMVNHNTLNKTYGRENKLRDVSYMYSPIEIFMTTTIENPDENHTVEDYAEFLFKETQDNCGIFGGKFVNRYGVSVYGTKDKLTVSWYLANRYSDM